MRWHIYEPHKALTGFRNHWAEQPNTDLRSEAVIFNPRLLRLEGFPEWWTFFRAIVMRAKENEKRIIRVNKNEKHECIIVYLLENYALVVVVRLIEIFSW